MSVRVSFYTDSHIASQVRTAEFADFSADNLVGQIKRSMRDTEKFACFRSSDGSVIALNQTGNYIIL